MTASAGEGKAERNLEGSVLRWFGVMGDVGIYPCDFVNIFMNTYICSPTLTPTPRHTHAHAHSHIRTRARICMCVFMYICMHTVKRCHKKVFFTHTHGYICMYISSI